MTTQLQYSVFLPEKTSNHLEEERKTTPRWLLAPMTNETNFRRSMSMKDYLKYNVREKKKASFKYIPSLIEHTNHPKGYTSQEQKHLLQSVESVDET
jgi:hypothetical protein